MPTEKAELRQIVRRRLREWGPERAAEASLAISKKLLGFAAAGQTVLAYWPLRSEPDIRGTLEVWLEDGVKVCLPRVAGEQMSAHELDTFDALLRSDFGVLEPDPASHPEIEPAQIDTVLVPGVAFTTDGARLGRGGGHYDRFLTKLGPSASTVGVGFSVQLLDEIPLEPHDVRLGQVVTE